jgi:transposase
VNAALENGLDDPQGSGRHSAFDDASEVEILEWVRNQSEKFNPITRTDVLQYYQAKYSSSISREWVNSFVLRHQEDLSEVKTTPKNTPA